MCIVFTWLSPQPPLTSTEFVKLIKQPGDLWSGMRWRPLVSFKKYRWKRLYHLAGKFCLHILRTLNVGFHFSNPRASVEKVHRYNDAVRPLGDVQHSHEYAEDPDMLLLKVFDLENFFPEAPHRELDRLLSMAICLILTRSPRWRFF